MSLLISLSYFSTFALFAGNEVLELALVGGGCLLFSFYIIYDTQMMVGGQHKYSLDPEDYVFASIRLYIDIARLFLRILFIIRRIRR